MELLQVENWVRQIRVVNLVNADVRVTNNSPLRMIGKGRQGAVFRVTDDMCVKIFGNRTDCQRESQALSMGRNTNLFPRVYKKGPNYLVMETVKGLDLREYLQSHPLTPALSYKLIQMLVTFKKIGFQRIDHHKRQIFIQPNGDLKVIDVARTIWRDRVYPYPRKLLNSLGSEHRANFLTDVRSMSPELYREWKYYMDMEQSARSIYQKLLANPTNLNSFSVRQTARALITRTNGTANVKQLEDLLHKVFKEEWQRVNQGSASRTTVKKTGPRIQRSSRGA